MQRRRYFLLEILQDNDGVVWLMLYDMKTSKVFTMELYKYLKCFEEIRSTTYEAPPEREEDDEEA